ncbi:MAG: VacJ family lipoprotein [Pseudomonadales bacterium]|nr:VacJ family lipoprotein [Pseudomonadales bacterium]MCP5331552.1 VacJ family lipoprotein [Pseudomonadales bacterium]MCP5343435.1 VacJ family lipoprotein [Pseudomonadales bacterium]
MWLKSILRTGVLGILVLSSSVVIAADPWEKTNRRIDRFNNFMDSWLLRPVALTYSTVVPGVVRQCIGNFFSNVDDINVLANDLLQLKLMDAASDSGRLLINTTVGLVGVIDVASSVGLSKNEEDFGQTFGRWGVGSGPYVVLPFFGPSSARDSVGLVLDTLFNPIQYYEDGRVRTTLTALRYIDDRASVFSMEGLISGDEYLFVREAYLQQREYLVNDGAYYDDFDDF